MTRDPVMALIQARGVELVDRAEQLERWSAAGESTSAAVQVALLADEALFLRQLAAVIVDEAEMRLIERRCGRLARELGVDW